MIALIAGAVVWVFLHTETDQITQKKNAKFFNFKLGIFGGKLGKKEDILDWEWAEYRTLVIGRKCPANTGFP